MSIFGWGKLKEKTVIDEFGNPDDLARAVGFPAMAAPVFEPPPAPPDTADVDAVVAAAMTQPLVDLGPSLGSLPPIAPREWLPARSSGATRGLEQGTLSYVEMSGVSVPEALELAERVGGKLKR